MSRRSLKTPGQRVMDLILTPLHIAILLWLLVYIPCRTAVMQAILWWCGYKPVRDPDDPHFDVICISHVPWRHIWQRNQHTMTRLARDRHVVYLQQFGPAYIHVFARWAPGIFLDWAARNDRVLVRMPLLYPGESRFGFLKRMNRWILGTYLRWREWQLELRNTVLWFYYPGTVYVLDVFEPAAVVYDIQDEYSAFYWAPRDISKREKKLLRLADVLFAGTHALQEKKSALSPAPCYFFPCGVEFEHFQTAVPGSALSQEPQAELGNWDGPRLLYMGLIDARIDADLIVAVARARPTWQIVMIGPVDRAHFDDARVRAEAPNVLFLGKMDYGRLPRFMAHADIFIMPWKINELTLHINPTKTLEYLAAARPVVSVSLPDLENFFGDTVGLVKGPDEFVAACEEALDGSTAGRVARGVEVARSYSWDVVVAQMAGYVQEARARRAGRSTVAAASAATDPYGPKAAPPAEAIPVFGGPGQEPWQHCPPEFHPGTPVWRIIRGCVGLVFLPIAALVVFTVVAAMPVISFFESGTDKK